MMCSGSSWPSWHHPTAYQYGRWQVIKKVVQSIIAALFNALSCLAQSSGAAVVTMTHGEQQDVNAQVCSAFVTIYFSVLYSLFTSYSSVF